MPADAPAHVMPEIPPPHEVDRFIVPERSGERERETGPMTRRVTTEQIVPKACEWSGVLL